MGPMRKHVNRRTFLSGALAAAGAALVACGQPLPTPVIAQPTAAPAAKPAAAPTTAAAKPAAAAATAAPSAAKPAVAAGQVLLRMHSRTNSEGKKPEAAIKVVEEQNPNIKVQLETFPGSEFTTKVLALAAGGQVGDLMWGSPNNYHIQVGNGLWFDVMPLVQSTNYDLKPFFKSAIDYLTAHDGKLWSLPYKAHPGAPALWYNKEALEAAGVKQPAPKSYDELTELALKVHKGGTGGAAEQWGLFLNTSINHAVVCLTRAFGVEEVEPVHKATKSIIGGEKHLQAFQWVHDQYHKHKVAPLPGPGADIGEDAWAAGRGAMFQASSSTKGAEPKIAGKFTSRNVLMPPGPGGKVGTKMVFDNFGMYNKTKHPEEAFKVLGYFCGKEHGIRLGLPEGGGSWTCGAREDVFFADELMNSTPNHKIFADVIVDAQAAWYPANFRLNEYETTLTQEYQKLMLDAAPITMAKMQAMQAALQAVLDRPAP